MVWMIFLAFIAVPAVEIALFIQIGGWLGLFPTLAVVFLTAAAGTVLLRRQGFDVIRRAQANMDAGELPVREVCDGLFLSLAGVLLLTPGFFTDAVGFLLFVPSLRTFLISSVATRVVAGANSRVRHPGNFGTGPHPGHDPRGRSGFADGGGSVIDGEYTEIPDEAEGGFGPRDTRRDD